MTAGMDERFAYHNVNPLGLRTGDCVFRAMSYFRGVTWNKAVMDIVNFATARGRVSFNYISTFSAFLQNEGYQRHPAPRKGMTVREFIQELGDDKRCFFLSCNGHCTIVHEGVLIDTWPCFDRKVIAYWVR